MRPCVVCEAAAAALLDVGPQPIASHFESDATGPAPRHSLALAQCGRCGLVQLEEAAPLAILRPPYEWLAYTEPEGHLDTVADLLAELAPRDRTPTAAGASYKDDTLLRRLRDRGFDTWRIDPYADLAIDDPRAGIETLQAALDPAAAARLLERHPAADVVVARHVLEHAYDPLAFATGLERLVRPGGHLVLEVPDCTRSFESLDYTTLWEEHVVYFTPSTFGAFLVAAGLDVVRLESFPYTLENSLVAVTLPTGGRSAPELPEHELETERERVRRFAESLPARREAVRRTLAGWAEKGTVALFGAGHLSCMFVAVMGVGDSIAFVADDSPQKQGLRLAGSSLPILPSSALRETDVSLCLLGVGPEAEAVVVPRLAEVAARGASIASLLPASTRALRLDP